MLVVNKLKTTTTLTIEKKMFIIFSLFVFSFFSSSPSDAKLFPIAVRLPLNGTPPESGASLWPMPVMLDVEREHFFIDKSKLSMTQTNLNKCELEIVQSLWSHYQNVIFPPKLPYRSPGSNDPQMNSVVFSLHHQSKSLKENEECSKTYYPYIEDTEEESCRIILILSSKILSKNRFLPKFHFVFYLDHLEVSDGKTMISASTVWGLVRGLESFSQLIYTFPDNRVIVALILYF